MAVYVDALFTLPSRNPQAHFVGTRTGHRWCHMFADTEPELHATAAKIGLRRAWYQSHSRTPHYDLTPSKRKLALAAGAKEIDARAWFKRTKIMAEFVG